ncbi:flavin reductase family protein [Shewanella halotolerans]|uniref:flavin reductase family protein n=1 Tax=Shewanella halotolerans TaxID=2864204 RepID=UPI001C65F12F|nr:flavin reductase family protein [Shewanella halotolerans]QYJ90506.1 flavin reductase family protein [Shewanella halotolerans]
MDTQARYYYEPSKGHGLAHDPLNAIVGPRPIGWIASRSPKGHRNLAPYSFFNCFNYHPPIIGFASVGYKDSLANILATGEFVWNLATRPLAEKMNLTSAALPAGSDEFDFAGLTPVPGSIVGVDRVAESPVNFECRLTQSLQLQSAAGEKIETWLVLGEVVAVHIDPSLIEDGSYQTAKAEPILRAGGPSAYYGISEALRFDMQRPQVP